MQPVTLNAADVSTWVNRLWWPALRVSGFVLSAPAASETSVPGLVKIVLTLGLAFLLAPLVQVPAGLSIFSAAGLLSAMLELLIGVSIGMQRGLWGLGEAIWRRVFRKTPSGPKAPAAQGEKA